MKLKIFFSWQTETESKYNKNFILTCIEKAVKNVRNKPEFKGVEFIIEEGVSGEPGSPGVAAKIIDERIPNCDIFIADLSVVNQIGWLAKWIQKTIDKKKFRPSPNSNVINEYGVATNAIGPNKIVGILNTYYGSPIDNSNNLPFDIRHLRFPLSYKYSSQKDKEKAQKDLVNGLTAALRDTGLFALQHQKSKHSPLMVWSDWEMRISTKEAYIPNAKEKEIRTLINEAIGTPANAVRILGLSGLGKTRMLLEIFRPIDNDDNSIFLSSRVLYINCNDNPNTDYQAVFTRLNSEQEGRFVILDNCSIEIHRQAVGFAKHKTNKTIFLSIDSNPEEINHTKINGVNYLVINKEDLVEVVNEILEKDFKGIGEDNIRKIKEFSQGIPLMAVLLAESVKNGEKFIGKLEDRELLDKMLGPKGQNLRNRAILKACSIFNNFGFSDELASQVDFIAKNKHITSLDGDDIVILNEFNEICNYYLKREIFERKGRFIGMRPFPLAMSLAQEWLEPCTPERLIEVITAIAKLKEPDRRNLSEALSEQMKYLGYNDKAVEIVDRIVGPGSPFDNAEVLNTELGSRLFRSFVEVNPVAVSKNLTRAFGAKSIAELEQVKDGRRNLVWVLEKLCFDKRTFENGIKILYSFAVAENESWANNARAQFLHLFNILLPGTEASLEDRWEIIEWGLNKNEDKYFELAVAAMKTALNYGHFHRMGGAEKQGSKQLMDYEPPWKEIAEYWNKVLVKLAEIIFTNKEYSVGASDSIAQSIRTFFRLRLGQIILPFLNEIASFKNYDWDAALQGLKITKRYEKNALSDKNLNQINELIKQLTKTDFTSRYLTLSRSTFLDDDIPYSEEKIRSSFAAMAEEFVNGEIQWLEVFPTLYKHSQAYSYYFGKEVFELLKGKDDKVQAFIQLSLKFIGAIDKHERNASVLGGFIAESDPNTKAFFYSYLSNLDELRYLLFYFISIDEEGKKYFDILFELVNKDQSFLASFSAFMYSKALSKLSVEELYEFSNKLIEYGIEGYPIVFEIFFNLWYSNDKPREELLPILKNCVYSLGVKIDGKWSMDSFKWSQTIISILSNKTESEFARFVNSSLINSISFDNLLRLEYEMQSIYEILIKTHFDTIWPELSAALLATDEQYMKFFGLKEILGSRIGGVGRKNGLLFEGNIEEIFEWCAKNKDLAPNRLAELTPIYGDNNTDFNAWHPIARKLIDEFGDNEEMLNNLGSNMGTYSWVGSIVPMLEAKKGLFSQLKNDPKETVRKWAESNLIYIDKHMEVEKNRDAETYL